MGTNNDKYYSNCLTVECTWLQKQTVAIAACNDLNCMCNWIERKWIMLLGVKWTLYRFDYLTITKFCLALLLYVYLSAGPMTVHLFCQRFGSSDTKLT